MPSAPPPDAVTAADAPSTSLDVVRRVLAPGSGPALEMLAVGGDDPKFLLPAGARAGAAVCGAYGGLRPARRRLERSAVAAGVRLGAGRVVGTPLTLDGDPGFGAPDGGLVAELSSRLGSEVHVGVGLGRLDAYWKPVLQVFGPDHRPLAYAKVGWSPVTRELVETEHLALSEVAGRMPGVVAPAPLDRFEWGDLVVVVVAPLPPRSRRLGGTDDPPPPPRSLERVDAGPATRALGDTSWWSEVLGRLRAGAAAEAIVTGHPALSGVADLLDDRLSSRVLPTGRQHGDWVPWNLARDPRASALVVWDWEYSRGDSPLGVDLAHGRYQAARLLRGASAAEAFAHTRDCTDPVVAALHAAMVAARRCWAALTGGAEAGEHGELDAALGALGGPDGPGVLP